jgi:dTDP-4-amino-4,6-dideoxygalactose transaminase
MANLDAVMSVAERHGLVVIEDAAQAIGAEHKGGRAGGIGHYGCLSFFPSKNLGAAGDGGMVVTNDAQRAEKLMCLRAHGSKPKYHHKLIGGNFRLDALQAAVVSAKFPYLDEWTAARQRNAERYAHLFAASGLDIADCVELRVGSRSSLTTAAGNRRSAGRPPHVVLPRVVTDRHIFNQYVIRTSHRDQVRAALAAKGVATEIYYPVPLHLQECFSYLGHKAGAFPESESAANETLALPIYPELTDRQACYVVDCIRDFFRATA